MPLAMPLRQGTIPPRRRERVMIVAAPERVPGSSPGTENFTFSLPRCESGKRPGDAGRRLDRGLSGLVLVRTDKADESGRDTSGLSSESSRNQVATGLRPARNFFVER
eukprot:RCo010048